MNAETELVTSWDALDGFADDWRRLWQGSEECSAEFYDYAFSKRVAQQFVNPSAHPWVVIMYSDSKVAAIAPLFFRRDRLTRLRIAANTVTFFPNAFVPRHGMLCNGPLDPLVKAVLQYAHKEGNVDVVSLSGLSQATALKIVEAAKDANVTCSVMQLNSRTGGVPGTYASDLCAISLPDSWDEYLSTRRRSFRKELRHAERAAAELGDISFWRYTCGKQIAGQRRSIREIVDWIEGLEQHTWQARKGFHLGRHQYQNVESLFEVADRAGALDVALLFHGEQPIAYSFGIVSGAFARSCGTGYDRRFARISPGILLQARVIQSSIECTDIRSINLGGSPHYTKVQFADERDSSFEVVLYAKTPKGMLISQYRRWLVRRHTFPAKAPASSPD
jgi:CelD/BcsL family acetyltransferase involved in cellulose biosynthesis